MDLVHIVWLGTDAAHGGVWGPDWTGLDWHGAGCEGVIVLCKFIERRLDWSG